LGFLRKWSGVPTSTTSPSDIKTIRSATALAKPISWLTTIIVGICCIWAEGIASE